MLAKSKYRDLFSDGVIPWLMCKDFCRPKRQAQAPLFRAVAVVGDRWSLPILAELQTGPKRYSELAREHEGLATNILAARLRRLLAEGIVARLSPEGRNGHRVYGLTRKGRDFAPVLTELERWGRRHDPAEQYRRAMRAST